MPTAVIKTTLQWQATAEPLYKQIAQNILQCLAQGEWKPGAQLPTEHELAERFGVAIYTVRAGIGQLTAAGILVRRQGKGTFVARHDRDRRSNLYSKVFHNDNRQLMTTNHAVTLFRKQLADDHAKELLHLDRRQKQFVFYWEAILKEKERVIGFRRATMPAHLFPGLTARALRGKQENMYAFYEDLCGVNVIRFEDRVRAIRADAQLAKVLGVDPDAPLLQIDRISFTYNDVPVELRTRIFDGSRYHYHTTQLGI